MQLPCLQYDMYMLVGASLKFDQILNIQLLLYTLGAFGKVHKGIYAKGTETFDIAIKTLRGSYHSCKLPI